MSWTRISERGSLFGMRLMLACLRVLGIRAASALIEPVVLYFFATDARARAASRRYLERVYSTDAGRRSLGRKPGTWTSWMHFRAFGHSLLDRAAFWCGLGDRYEVSFAARAEHERLQASGRGAIFLGAHLGSFDVLRALATRKNKPVNLVEFQAGARKVNTLFREIAPEMEMRAIHVDPNSIQSILDVKTCVDRGEFVAILADRAELSSHKRVGKSVFFGAEAAFPLGPFWIAHILDCPVYLIFALRGKRRSYAIHFERFAERVALDRRRRESDLQAWLDRYVQRLEAECLRAPLQWFNFYDFWGSRAGEGVESHPAASDRRAADPVRTREAVEADMRPDSHVTVVAGSRALSIEEVVALARGDARIALPSDESWRRHMDAGVAFMNRCLETDALVYGVNTGYGDSLRRGVPPALAGDLPRNLTRYHGCGLGRDFDPEVTAAVLAARIASLARGYSGVRRILLERLCALLNERVLPLIPEEGSVGASGDLTPMSYVAAVIAGERDVLFRGERMEARRAFAIAGIEPLDLAPKEALAIMNGTAVMTAIACLAFARADYLLELASRITALAALALRANPGQFDARLFELKPHAGQMRVASWIRAALEDPTRSARLPSEPIQDPYSLRCAPHVLGVLADLLPWIRTQVETELNSANDNPLFDHETERVLHGGHFYGGHIAMAMDALKIAVANVADLLDRQLALLVDERTNRGLPANLSGAPPDRACVHHGLKAVQIATSAWTAEALKGCTPASVFSRSTECHNQDKVSMGTIAARDAIRVLELSEQVAAALLVGTVQALALRLERGERSRASLSVRALAIYDAVREDFPLLVEDRPLDATLRTLIERIRARAWVLESRPGSAPSAGARETTT